MKPDQLNAILSSIVSHVRMMGTDAFKSRVLQQETGDVALALRDISSFSSLFCSSNYLVIHQSASATIKWEFVQSESAVFQDIDASNDCMFALAA